MVRQTLLNRFEAAMPGMLVICLLWLGTMTTAADTAATGGKTNAMTAYRDAVLKQLGRLESNMPEITKVAEQTAGRIIDGGNLYVSGQEAFISEAGYRAGGLMMLAKLDSKVTLTGNDTVLVGAWTNQDEVALAACRRARDAGSFVVLFSPEFESPAPPVAKLCDAHIVNFAAPDGFLASPDGKKIHLPTSPVFDVTALWAYTGELVGALTRKSKTPVIWMSVGVPEGRKRNALYFGKDLAKRRFHDDMTMAAQQAGAVGLLYIDTLRRCVNGLRGPTLEQLSAAASLMAAAVRGGGAVHVKTVSHFTRYEVQSPAVPRWVKADYEKSKADDLPRQLKSAMKPGDVYFELGYYCQNQQSNPALYTPVAESVRSAGGKSVIALCHASAEPLNGQPPDMLIDAQWDYGDAAIFVSGYDAKLLPASGVLQTIVFWTVIGGAENLLSE